MKRISNGLSLELVQVSRTYPPITDTSTSKPTGTISVLFTYPLELIRVRLAFETRASSPFSLAGQKPTLLSAISQIYHEGSSTGNGTRSLKPSNQMFETFPLLKFYRGFSVTLLGMVPYAGTSFLVWGFLRSFFIPQSKGADTSSRMSTPKISPLINLALGGIAGAVAQTASYPFEIVRRRMQVGGVIRPDRWISFNEVVRTIWRQSGWRGFFVGLGIGYIKVVPMSAVSYAAWEFGKRLFGV
jgi:solute carrier family 25 (mitochondrial carrier protein), member 16